MPNEKLPPDAEAEIKEREHAERIRAAAPEMLELLRVLQWRRVDRHASLLHCVSCDVTRAPDVSPNCFPGCKLTALLKRIDGDEP